MWQPGVRKRHLSPDRGSTFPSGCEKDEERLWSRSLAQRLAKSLCTIIGFGIRIKPEGRAFDALSGGVDHATPRGGSGEPWVVLPVKTGGLRKPLVKLRWICGFLWLEPDSDQSPDS